MTQLNCPIYLDCNASSPLEPRVQEHLISLLEEGLSNPSSRTHSAGLRANKKLEDARKTLALLLETNPTEVIFTSGATEANNLALLGSHSLSHGERGTSIVTTCNEHSSIFSPLSALRQNGVDIRIAPVTAQGNITAESILDLIDETTTLVSITHVSGESGFVSPLSEVAAALDESGPILHVDSAQGFTKENHLLASSRIDLISVSSHKINGPKGVGALIGRRSSRKAMRRLRPILFGGGQERSLRPGTAPVELISAFVYAAELAFKERDERVDAWKRTAVAIQEAFETKNTYVVTDPNEAIGNCVCLGIRGIDSEAVILALKDVAWFSNGSACSSGKSTASRAYLSLEEVNTRFVARELFRLSWCHLTPEVPIKMIQDKLKPLR